MDLARCVEDRFMLLFIAVKSATTMDLLIRATPSTVCASVQKDLASASPGKSPCWVSFG